MFFPDRIRSIQPNHRVLEIGPGGTPHPRADIFLDRRFPNPDEARLQRGNAPELQTQKQIVYYEDDVFPFKDKEFDYVICSHVLEHVHDLDKFVPEVVRVGKAGYFEFPTIYYDYLYDIPGHVSVVFYDQQVIRWMPKAETGISAMRDITQFLYQTLVAGYHSGIEQCKPFLFQGFEWSNEVKTRRATRRAEVGFDPQTFTVPPPPRGGLLKRIGRWLSA